MKKKIFLLLTILLLSCQQAEVNKQNVVVETITVDNNNNPIDIIENISFVPLKEDKNALIAYIDKVLVKNDNIYILDKYGAGALFCFSKKGDFITRFGSKGKAPAEYLRLWDFDVDSNYVYLYDRQQMKLLVFDLKGNYVSEHKTPFRAVALKVLPQGGFLFALEKENEKTPMLVKTNADFSSVEPLLHFQKDYIDDNGTGNIFQHYADGILFNRAVNDSVYVLSKEGAIKSVYAFDFGKETVPPELKNSFEKLVDSDRTDYTYLLGSPIQVNNLLIGECIHKEYKATFVYDIVHKKTNIFSWLPNQVRLNDVIQPLTLFDGQTVLGWLDTEVYENLKDKSVFPDSLLPHLEQEGKVLIFYQIKK